MYTSRDDRRYVIRLMRVISGVGALGHPCDMSLGTPHQSRVAVATSFLALIALLIGWDLWVEWDGDAGFLHLVIEITVFLVAAIGALALWLGLRTTREKLEKSRKEAAKWRHESEELLRGLGDAIHQQFRRWALTSAESEVALLILKGLSHKEIAAVRGASERTIREQARVVYRKSGLSGRAELAAFFLEDLLLPSERTD